MSKSNPIIEPDSKLIKQAARLAWEKFCDSIKDQGLKVIVIIEGDQNESTIKLINTIQKWSKNHLKIQKVTLENIISKKANSYFEPIISQLPKAGEISIFEKCWFEKGTIKSQFKKWGSTLVNDLKEKESMMREAGYIILKYGFKDVSNGEKMMHPACQILQKTENKNRPIFYFKCWEKKHEPYILIHHLANQIPHQKVEKKKRRVAQQQNTNGTKTLKTALYYFENFDPEKVSFQ